MYRVLYRVLLYKPYTRLLHCPTLRTLIHNIRTQSLFLGLLNTSSSILILLTFLTKGQYRPLVKKNRWTLSIRGVLVRQRKPSYLFVSKSTGTIQMYYLVWMCLIPFQLSALCYGPTCGLFMQKNISLFLKQLTRVEWSSQTKIIYIFLKVVCQEHKEWT